MYTYLDLERGSCLSGKGVVNHFSLELGYHIWITVPRFILPKPITLQLYYNCIW